MIWQDILHSTQIKRAGYDPNKKELYIEFSRGVQYVYYDVGSDVYVSLVGSSKASDFFNKEIKGKYQYKKL